jgi:transcriptional regulator with XRE-family HTH domain
VVLEPEDIAALSHTVGYVLRDARVKRGLIIKELSELTSLSESALSRLECGRRPLTVRQLIVLCDVLGAMPSVAIARAEREAFPFGWPEDVGDRSARPLP